MFFGGSGVRGGGWTPCRHYAIVIFYFCHAVSKNQIVCHKLNKCSKNNSIQATKRKGAFGEVWLAQAFQIRLMDPRNKSAEAKKQRNHIRGARKIFEKTAGELAVKRQCVSFNYCAFLLIFLQV